MTKPFQELFDRVNIYNEFLRSSEMRMELIENNHAIASLCADSRLLNCYGYIHGGAIYSLADTACGICAMTNAPDAVTLNGLLNFVHPGRAGMMYAEAKTVHSGKTTGVYEVRVYNEENDTIAAGTFTMFLFRDKKPNPDAPHKKRNQREK